MFHNSNNYLVILILILFYVFDYMYYIVYNIFDLLYIQRDKELIFVHISFNGFSDCY